MLKRRGFARVNVQLLFIAIAGLMISACAGCGESDGTARVAMFGKIAFKGTPVTAGSVSLLPAEGNDAPTANVTIQQGAYRFDKTNGPAAGKYRMLVIYSTAEAAAGSSKVASFQSKQSGKNGEFESRVEVPAGKEFEHNIEIK